jgi:hypothetical protein
MSNLSPVFTAGFFSTCTVTLNQIIMKYNEECEFPDISTASLMEWYKEDESINSDIWCEFFKSPGSVITEVGKTILFTDFMEYEDGDFTYLGQFSPYKRINYKEILPIINSYFDPSERVLEKMNSFLSKYEINTEETIGVYYRGNDKLMEANPPSYEEYIDKIGILLKENPKYKILIQTDEKEFLDHVMSIYPDSIFIPELPVINKSYEWQVVWTIEDGGRTNFGVEFMAISLILSRCSKLILNSCNVSMWVCLYRGNAEGVSQYLNPRKYFYLNDYKYYFESENKWF